jgi:WASH complex subunit strumpellin
LLFQLFSGFYPQHTVEGLLLDQDGKQLMCETLYLYGVILLLMDNQLPGPVRERMIVGYYRSKGDSVLDNFDEVCRLCRSTGFVPGGKRPANYPEEYFARLPVPKEMVRMIIGRLQSDDVYLQTRDFPSPEHRSVALATQASMLYIILYFEPDLLHKNRTSMREIVDRHFNDNWIIPIYMGFVVDLSVEWNGYRAAKEALRNTLELGHIRDLQVRPFGNEGEGGRRGMGGG